MRPLSLSLTIERICYQSGKAPSEIKLQFRVHYSERRARISFLRTAYLAAFATLGYRYTLRPVLDIVRKRIKCPDKEVIKYFSVPLPQDRSFGQNIILLREPDWVKGIAIELDHSLYLLPLRDGDDNFYRRPEGLKLAGQTINFRGEPFRWPRYPEYRLDFAKSHEIQALLSLLD